MKKLSIASALVAALVLVSGSAFASGSGTATSNVTASIVPALSISNTGGMAFGTIIADANAPSTISLTTNGGASVAAGNATIVVSSTHTAASFAVSGAPGATYSITLPVDGAIIADAIGDTMLVNNFASSPDSTIGGSLSVSGGQLLNVGATLSVAASQNVGNYAGTFDVTVNYN